MTGKLMIASPWCIWIGLLAYILTVLFAFLAALLADVSGGTIRKLEETDPQLAKTFRGWLDKRDHFRVALRILKLATLLLTFLCVTSWIHCCLTDGNTSGRPVAAVVTMALVYLFVVEILGSDLPSALRRHALRVLIPLARAMSLPILPLAYPLSLWHQAINRRRESGSEETGTTTTEDEIMSLVEKDEEAEGEAATLEEDERRMIKGIFDLDETLVREIMTPRVDLDALDEQASINEARRQILDSGHSRIPIYHDSIDRIIGILHAKDLLDEERLQKATGLGDLLHPTIFIPETKNVGDLLQEFQQNVTHFAVVVDEYGGTAGIITLEDILEEIVGEIQDEYDHESDEPIRHVLPDGGVIVDARTMIYDLNQDMDLGLPEDEDFDTLGGYVSYRLGRIPRTGEVINTEHCRLEILEADQRRILRAKLMPLQADTDNDLKTSAKDSS